MIINTDVLNKCPSPKTRKRVLVTGTEAVKYDHLGDVVHTPLIALMRIPYNSEIEHSINGSSDMVVFTSRYSVRFWMEHLLAAGQDTRWFAGRKIVSIGRVTSMELASYGLVADFQAEEESSSGILALFWKEGLAAKKILMPRSDKALDSLPKGLAAMGNSLVVLSVYANTMPLNPVKVDLAQFDAVVFSSPSGVRNFVSLYGHIPSHLEIIARGEQVEAALITVKNQLKGQ